MGPVSFPGPYWHAIGLEDGAQHETAPRQTHQYAIAVISPRLYHMTEVPHKDEKKRDKW